MGPTDALANAIRTVLLARLPRTAAALLVAPSILFGCAGARQPEPTPQIAATSAREYLERRQEEAHSQFGYPPRVESEEARRRRLDDQLDNMLSRIDRAFQLTPAESAVLRASIARQQAMPSPVLPTRLQDPDEYGLLLFFTTQVEKMLSDRGAEGRAIVATRRVMGTAPIGEPNAWVYEPQKGEFVLIFSSGLFEFADLASRIVVSAIPIESVEGGWVRGSLNSVDVERHLDKDPAIVQRFARLLISYLVQGRAVVPAGFFNEPGTLREGLASRLFLAVGLFLVGHEYGHIAARSRQVNQHPDRPGGRLPDRMELRRREELDADAFGAEVALTILRQRPVSPAIAIAAVEFYFHCYEVLERARSVILTGSPGLRFVTDHPPASERRAHVRRTLETLLLTSWGVEPKEVERTLRDAGRVEAILEMLWRRSWQFWQRLYEDRQRLAPVWLKE